MGEDILEMSAITPDHAPKKDESITWINNRIMISTKILTHSTVAKEIHKKFEGRAKKRGKIICLVGVHGDKKGHVTTEKNEQLKKWVRRIPNFQNFGDRSISLQSFLKNMDVELEMLDISQFHVSQDRVFSQELDDKIKTVLNQDESMEIFLVLAMCYSNVSITNDILRSAGIYSNLIISEDRGRTSKGRCLTLDKDQSLILKEVSDYHANFDDGQLLQENKPKNILLWGSSGTGKTLILAQLLLMRVSHYKKRGVPLQVYIACRGKEDRRL